jgi:hypothetical protein
MKTDITTLDELEVFFEQTTSPEDHSRAIKYHVASMMGAAVEPWPTACFKGVVVLYVWNPWGIGSLGTFPRYAKEPHEPKNYSLPGHENVEGALEIVAGVLVNKNRELEANSKRYLEPMFSLRGEISLVRYIPFEATYQFNTVSGHFRSILFGPWKCELRNSMIPEVNYEDKIPTLWTRLPYTGERRPMELGIQVGD